MRTTRSPASSNTARRLHVQTRPRTLKGMSPAMQHRVAWVTVWTLSLSRLGLAGLFPVLGPAGRIVTVFAAAASDALDGYLARRFRVTSWWGAVVDAGTDKLFTLTVLVVVTSEGALSWWQLALLLPRDAVVLALIAVFAFQRRWNAWRQMDHRPLGKAATAAQFALLLVVIAAADATWLIWPLFSIAVVVTALSAIDYLARFGALTLVPRPPEVADALETPEIPRARRAGAASPGDRPTARPEETPWRSSTHPPRPSSPPGRPAG
jgi:CDP-diacylglycerol--glycerol-3-phosphate 3-phosphatidyltransferase